MDKKTGSAIGRSLKEYFSCSLGSFLFVFSVNVIISPLGLYNGGFVGASQLMRYSLETFANVHVEMVDLASVFFFLMNAPLFILAYKSMSKTFFAKTVYNVILQTVLLSAIPVPSHSFTNDMLTACIVGGLVAGMGVGILLKAGSSGGGQDILGVYCSKKYPGFSVGKIVLVINGAVYGYCALLFDLEIVVYSLIYTFVMTIIIDKVHAQNINNAVLIFTKKEGLDDYLIATTKRGVSMWEGWGGYTKEKLYIGVIALSKYEIPVLKHNLAKFDKDAFVIVNEELPIFGNFEKRFDA